MPTNLYGKPFQLNFTRASQMSMFANFICDPPLGQSTVVPFDQQKVDFHVCIESSKSFAPQPWETVIWHNAFDEGRWDSLHLKRSQSDVEAEPLTVSTASRPKVYRHYFTGSIARPKNGATHIEFTLKFRPGPSQPWRWVNDRSGLANGDLLFQAESLPLDIAEYFSGYNSSFNVEQQSTNVRGARLWTLSHVIDSAGGKAVTESNVVLGVPLSVLRWFALARIWTPWLAPRHGKRILKLNEDAILCSFLRSDGFHLVLVAVSGVENVRTLFKSGDGGEVVVSSSNDDTEAHMTVIAAAASTFDDALEACMIHARETASRPRVLDVELKKELTAYEKVDDDVKAQWMENWYDGLTYCTWNSLGQNLTDKKIYNALDSLKRNGIHVTNLIIDDNWQTLDNPGSHQDQRGWMEFEANKEGFPDGLRSTVINIRDNNPEIQHVAVWHALLGYWGAISPSGRIAKEYKTRKVTKGGSDHWKAQELTVIDPSDVQRYFNDFYQFLRDSQVDSVKTDAQFIIDLIKDAPDRREIIKAYQDAWTIATLRYFSTRAISCMSQIPQIIFHTQLPANKPKQMVRNSDDFFPEIPASHPWHIFTNAYTCLFTSHLNVLPDWDMFQTSHEYSAFHAAARCVSGGPIYLTDEPGKHDMNLIKQMTAMTNQKKTVILRPTSVGRTAFSGVYTDYHELRLLKVGTRHRASGPAPEVGILGVFNVSKQSLTEFVRLSDFPGIQEDREYIFRAHTTGEAAAPVKVGDRLAMVSLQLPEKGWEILSAYPLTEIAGNKMCALGLMGKMASAAAVTSCEYKSAEGGKVQMSVTTKALGVLGVGISTLPQKKIDEHFLVVIKGQAVPRHTVRVSESSEHFLEIDIETAWNEMGLRTAWNNEVTTEIVMS